MEFASFLFLVFFFVVLIGALVVPKGRPTILFYTVMSYIFYGMSFFPHIFLLFGITVINYALSHYLVAISNPQHIRRYVFTAAVFVNVGLLAFFKYAAFFIENINSLLNLMGFNFDMPIPQITYPLGISFYTFIILSYLIDLYRNQCTPAKSFGDFCFLVAFFPYLFSGPIVRSGEILPQIATFQPLERRTTIKGIELIVVGFFKKCVIGDNCAFVAPVFSDPSSYGAVCLWLAAFFFTVQIYCDFSGYTDIARGVAKLLGFNLPVNFRWPYFSHSIREFWRRWHMTLSFWIRDYIYFPLGGSRAGIPRYLYNIVITWFLCGLWHGAQYNFIVWGLYNGFFIALEHVTRQFNKKWYDEFHVPRFISVPLTFFVTMFGWVLFRCNKIEDAGIMIKKMLNPLSGSLFQGSDIFQGFPLVALFLLPLLHFVTYRFRYDVDNVSILDKVSCVTRVVVVTLAMLIIVIFAGERVPFIYSRF